MTPRTKHSTASKNENILAANATTNYVQAQTEEIEVLRAIYDADFEELQGKTAWKKTADKAFRLCLRALANPEISVLVSIRFTATYPKTPPLILLESTNGLRDKTRKAVARILETKPKELVGEVMIHELASALQDCLEDEAMHRAEDDALPTLDEERAKHEADTAELIRKEWEETQKKRLEEQADEDRTLQQMVLEEMKRRKEHKAKSKAMAPAAQEIPPGSIKFDNYISLQAGRSTIEFIAVQSGSRLQKTSISELRLVEPWTSPNDRQVLETLPPLLAIKKCSVNRKSAEENKRILKLESELETLKNLSGQANCQRVFEFKIDLVAGNWDVIILLEYFNKCSLREELIDFGTIPVFKARSWTLDLLEALDFYHRHGIVHKRIHSRNVLLSTSSSSSIIKLADASFQQCLHDVQGAMCPEDTRPSARSINWLAPEITNGNYVTKTSKSDIWDLGIVFLQMLFGLSVTVSHESPAVLLNNANLSRSLEDLIKSFFITETRKRPSAFEMISSEFLRSDASVYSEHHVPIQKRRLSSNRNLHEIHSARRGSTPVSLGQLGRYGTDWIEVGRIGKGGFGEVVKSRNRIDGRIYAIKKITQKSAIALSEVLSEAALLSRLNHPNVVRYYSAWLESKYESVELEENTIETDESEVTSSELPEVVGSHESADFPQSLGGLDFVSSSGYPKIVFGDDSDASDEDEDETDHETDSSKHDVSSPLNRSSRQEDSVALSRDPVPTKSTLYIQMEYCERHSLRDLIRKGLHESQDEGWRLFRQMLEGLAHIHSHGIIHRDLKPENIFIDASNSPLIGDFGLATRGQFSAGTGKPSGSINTDVDMTKSIGTSLYIAPEIKSNTAGSYTSKVDMYSLGIIFFEMCHPLSTAMERVQEIGAIRLKEHSLPEVFRSGEKGLQGSIIESLIKHRPSERPSSAELLQRDIIPVKIKDKTILKALKGISDPSSDYYHEMMSALFSDGIDVDMKARIWDMANSGAAQEDVLVQLLQEFVEGKLCAIFRRHMAVKTRNSVLLPRSAHYSNSNIVKLLHPSGTLVQLPFDFTLPAARSLATKEPASEKFFTFGTVYRETFSGGSPRMNGEADFDIVSHGRADLALKEAEVLRVLDEVVKSFPALSTRQMCFHLSHSDLLEVILDFARVPVSTRPSVKDILSKLNIHGNTWTKVKNELRSPAIGVPSTSLADLERFDFREEPEKAFRRVKTVLADPGHLQRAETVFEHLRTVMGYMKDFGIQCKVFVCPFSCFNEKFYRGGIMFQCLFDKKNREVLAAGGRYDSLIEEHMPRSAQGPPCDRHAVGMNLGWDRLVTAMVRLYKSSSKSSAFLKKSGTAEEDKIARPPLRRGDVLVACFDPIVLRTSGVRIVADLWDNGVSAELAGDASTPEEVLNRYRDDNHSWIVIIKHDPVAGKADLRVKSMVTKVDTDIRRENLINHLRAEMRERDEREEGFGRAGDRNPSSPLAVRLGSTFNANEIRNWGGPSDHWSSNVDVLMAQHKSKKSNKWNVVDSARSSAMGLLESYVGAPIIAVETTDEILDMVRSARLSDAESWRKVVHGVPLVDRAYVQQVHGLLEKYKATWMEEGRYEVIFLVNFRTGRIRLYELGL